MNRAIRFVKHVLDEIKHGLRDGITINFDPHSDRQEQDRQSVLRHIEDTTYEDKEVYQDFLDYCLKYDRTMRLTRTRHVLERMIDVRPEIRAQIRKRR